MIFLKTLATILTEKNGIEILRKNGFLLIKKKSFQGIDMKLSHNDRGTYTHLLLKFQDARTILKKTPYAPLKFSGCPSHVIHS